MNATFKVFGITAFNKLKCHVLRICHEIWSNKPWNFAFRLALELLGSCSGNKSLNNES